MHFFKGPNPAADLVIFVIHDDLSIGVALIQRSKNATAEPNKWGFPGGFVNSSSQMGGYHVPTETPEVAARRELKEETNITIEEEQIIVPVGVYEKGGRDPRDTEYSWTQSHAFVSVVGRNALPQDEDLIGLDDAQALKVIKLKDLALFDLAFDHRKILDDAVEVVKRENLIEKYLESVGLKQQAPQITLSAPTTIRNKL